MRMRGLEKQTIRNAEEGIDAELRALRDGHWWAMNAEERFRATIERVKHEASRMQSNFWKRSGATLSRMLFLDFETRNLVFIVRANNLRLQRPSCT